MTRERTRRVGCAIATMLACLVASRAQAQWDTSGFAAPGPDERVFALTSFDDGSGKTIYAGGGFGAIDGQPMSHIAQYKNGEWSPLGAGLSREVTCLTVLNGQVIAGGFFPGDVSRWDGVSWEAMGNGLTTSSLVIDLSVFNGQLIAAGRLTANGTDCDFAMWDGTTWQPMGQSIGSRGHVLEMFNGELFGGSAHNVSRWNGTAWVSIGQFNSEVHSLTNYNGNLIAGGIFTVVGGVPANRIAQWNGSSWAPLAEGIAGPGLPDAKSMQSVNGKLVVGGYFSMAGTTAANNLAEWNGSSWSAIESGVKWDLTSDVIPNAGAVYALLQEARQEGAFIVGGVFSTAGSLTVNNIVRRSGDQWQRLSECRDCRGTSGPIRSLLVHDDGRGQALFVAGACRVAGSLLINRIGRWDGAEWSTLGTGVESGTLISAMVAFDDGSGRGKQLFVGGDFTSIGGVAANNVARWDGQQWHPLGDGVDGIACAMTVFDDGSGPALYVGGNFTTAGGRPASRLAKWNGRTWAEVGGGVHGGASEHGGVMDMTVWNDGGGPALVVTGRFGGVGSGASLLSVWGLARWQGGTWSTIGGPGGIGSSGFGKSLAAWPGPHGTFLACAGWFGNIGGVPANGLAVWTGTTWQNLAPALTTHNDAFRVFSVSHGECDELFAYSLIDANRPAKWALVSRWNGLQRGSMGGLSDALGTQWRDLRLGLIMNYAAFTEFQGRLYVAGDFTAAGGQVGSNMAIWDFAEFLSCLADLNADHTIDLNDLDLVLSHWGPCEDCPEDRTPCGGDGQVNINDLLEVINQWGPCK